MAAAVQEVNRAFSQYHTGIEHLRDRARTNALRTDLSNADNLLKQLRQSAVQQIHATSTCAKTEDQDTEDRDTEDEDSDEHGASPSPLASPTAAPSATPTPSASASPSSSPLVSGSDPKTIADNAVAAMKLVFDTVSAEFPTPTASARPSRTAGHDGHGEGGEHD